MAISGLTNPLTQSPVTGGLLTMPVAGPTKPATVVQPVGQKTTAPGSNLPPPTNTTNQPAGTPPTPTYAFSGSLGVGSGQSAGTYQAPSATTLPALANQTATGNPASPTVSTPPTTATGAPAMTPPVNGGANGVSLGSIVGGEINNANNNPAYQAAINQYNSYTPQIQALQAATQNALTAAGTGGFESQAMGRQGLITQNTGGILQSLINAQTQALGAANSAQGEQGQTNTGLSSAAQATAPTFQTPGQVQINPTVPQSGSTPNGTAPGTAINGQNINSLLTTTPNATGPGTATAYSANGQTFATPQALSNFVNSQVSGANTNASNVFQYLQSVAGQQGGGSIVGGNNALNPISQIPTLANEIIANPAQYNVALTTSGSIPGFTSALQAQIRQQDPNFDFNAAVAQGNVQQSNISTAGTNVANTQAGIASAAATAYSNMVKTNSNITQIGNQVLSAMPSTSSVNPTDSTVLNSSIQNFLSNWANQPQYATLGAAVGALRTQVSALINTGQDLGSSSSQAQAIVNGTLPLASMSAAIAQIEKEGGTLESTLKGQADAAQSSLQSAAGGSSNSYLQMPTNGTTAAGGTLVYQNGQWVEK